MADIRDVRLITKRTSVPGKIPTGTTGDESSFIRAGELASNLADHSLWGYDGASVFEYGSSSFLGLTGGTISGNVFISGGLSATTLSGGTIYGDGSNLTGIVASWDGLENITVGENVGAGDLLFLSADSKYYKASSVSESYSSTELRISTSGLTANTIGSALIQGKLITTGLTSGAKYWVGSTFGTYSTVQPSSDYSIVRYIGTALDSTTLEFNPDQTYIEISSQAAPPYTGETNPSIRIISTSQSALSNDYTVVCISGLTLTLPTAVGIDGKIYNVKSRTTNTVTINTTGGQTIDDDASLSMIIKNTSIALQSDGSNWLII